MFVSVIEAKGFEVIFYEGKVILRPKDLTPLELLLGLGSMVYTS